MIDNKQQKINLCGKRVIGVRNTLGLSRRKFSKILGIPFGTVQNWEDVRYGGMNEAGADRLVKALSKHLDVLVSKEWLLHGSGQTPIFPNLIIHQSTDDKRYLQTEEQIITQEVLFFHKLNPNCMDCMIPDDLMQPFFSKDDRVAGNRSDDINAIASENNYCIVQLEQGETFVRTILKNKTKANRFDLEAHNHGDKTITHTAITLKQCAPIKWIRKNLTQN